MSVVEDAFSQAVALYHLGRYDEALAGFGRAVALDPGFAAAHNNHGVTLEKLGRVDEALASYERATALKPDYVDAHSNRGALLYKLGRIGEALASFDQVIALTPQAASAHNNRGSALKKLGRLHEALESYDRAIALDPDYVEAHSNRAITLDNLGRLDDALASFARAIVLDPGFATAYYNRGVILEKACRLNDALENYERAIALRPDYVDAHNNRGALLYRLGRIDEALASFDQVIALNPRSASAHNNRAGALKRLGRLHEALASYERAIALDPGYVDAHSNLVFTMMFACDDDEAILHACEKFSAQHETPLLAQPVPPYANDRSGTRRLRIGYVSPDFCHHCQSLFMMPLLSHHDHQRFEIFCYASVSRPDDMTRQLMPKADVWRDVCNLDDAQLAQQIRDDRIDVLVDLTMHMAHGRPLLFARRAAPVQVAWLAYPGTTGSRAIGYRLTDPWLDPPDVPHADERYSERSIRLPDAFWCYAPLVHGIDVNALPALANGYVTFGCLNNPAKVTEQTIQLWSRVLHALPTSRFILLAMPGEARAMLRERFAAQGIDPARVSFVSFQPRENYLRTCWQIDMALDTVPYNGHTTSLDSFWMGVPVVTRSGRSAVSRGGLSLLANLHMLELAADNDEDYVKIAVQLASDLPRLSAMRAGLRARMEQSPLMDGARFAQHIEQAYQQMWREWCAQQEQNQNQNQNQE